MDGKRKTESRNNETKIHYARYKRTYHIAIGEWRVLAFLTAARLFKIARPLEPFRPSYRDADAVTMHGGNGIRVSVCCATSDDLEARCLDRCRTLPSLWLYYGYRVSDTLVCMLVCATLHAVRINWTGLDLTVDLCVTVFGFRTSV